jgi:hypothetical protein
MTGTAAAVDLIEELRLRRWARENFVAPPLRDAAWHPIIHDEMQRRDAEELLQDSLAAPAIVPLLHPPTGGNWRPAAKPPLHRAGLGGDSLEMHYT